MMSILALWLALLQPDPHFTAQWDSATSATLQWTQVGRGCVYRDTVLNEHIFIGCYEKSGAITLELGHAGPIDGNYRPRTGDVFVLTTQGQVYRAPLRGRLLYLSVFRH